MIPIFEDSESPVPIIQGAIEFERLLKLYKHLRPMHVVEIGSLMGGSLFQFIKHAPKGAKIVSVDVPVSLYDSRYPIQRAGHDYLWNEWATAKQLELTVISRPSWYALEETVSILEGIDFLFIDGSHVYEDVKLDWEFYRPHIKSNGVVAFHDIYRQIGEDNVPRLWREIKDQGYVTREFSSILDQRDWGIGVVFL